MKRLLKFTLMAMLVVALLVWFVPGAPELVDELALTIVVFIVY